MNDSFSKISSPVPNQSNGGGKRGAQFVQIIKLPEALQTNARAVRVEGQVTQVNSNGTASIDTPEGRVEVQLRGNNQPQAGQRVEVEIPAGRPPRQAALRTNPTPQNVSDQNSGRSAQSQNQVQNQVQAPTQPQGNVQPTRITTPNQSGQPQQAVPQTTAQTTRALPQAPVPAAVQETIVQTTNVSNVQQARPLTQDALIRLLSVSPAQAQSISTQSTQSAPLPQINVLSQAALSANITAQNVSSQNAQTLLQSTALKSSPLQASNPTLHTSNAPLQNTLQSIPNTVSLTIATPQAIPTALPTSVGTTIPASQTLAPNSAVNLLGAQTGAPNVTPSNATLIPAPLTATPNNILATASPRLGQIDVQILKITPSTPIITSVPTSGAVQNVSIPAATTFQPPLISGNNAVTLTAQVTGFTPQGLPLVTLQVPGSSLPQSFVLQHNSNNLQLGSQLQILTKGTPNTLSAQPLQPTGVNSLLNGFQWPALDELYNGLLRVSPQAAASLTRALPNAGSAAQMAPAAMMFIAAVRSGDLGGWLGNQKMDLLQRAGKLEILSRMGQNNAAARAPAAEAAQTSDWRAVPLPMFWEGEIHKITLYTRHENQGQNQDQNDNNQTRFVFDLSLSRMGDIQLDGLLRDQRLDLVVRANNKFSEAMQQTMRQAYTTALSFTELSGDLNFQGSSKNWVHVIQEKEQLGVDA